MSTQAKQSEKLERSKDAEMTFGKYLVQRAKMILVQIYIQKRWIERAKYWGRTTYLGQAGHDQVAQAVASGCAAIGKIGESELRALRCYLKHRDADGFCSYWNPGCRRLYAIAGVFPPTPESFTDFAREFISAVEAIDVMAVWWIPGEARVVKKMAPKATLVGLRCLEPHFWEQPWVQHLEGKRVLVVSPFTETMIAQHAQLEKVWSKKPSMAVNFELKTLKTPLCAILAKSPYESWSQGLEDLRQQMSDIEFDVAIIGAGAWSLPLTAHAKSLGKVGFHLGGATQLLFGIRGRRWDVTPSQVRYQNEYWKRPAQQERPSTYEKIEGGCYW